MLISHGVIGRGGFGTVDLVEDEDGQTFARKTFSVNQPISPHLYENVLKRFKKEIRTQRAINSRNIVPILYYDFDTVPPFYLMPVAISGLDKDIANKQIMGSNFVAVISDIVAGLDSLHSLHIYHRDLKPQNVLRFNDQLQGPDYYAIGDFGLISMQESQLSLLTSTGMARGADNYTAPEITQDLRYASIQSDIYSLGCILHDFVGKEGRVPCNEIRENSPFGAILLGCTRKNPNQRFRSTRAVLDAIVSIDMINPASPTSQAADFISMLESDLATIPYIRWRNLADFLYSVATLDEIRAIFMHLNEGCIEFICREMPTDARVIGLCFTGWITKSAFNFDYCDGLANRLEIFFQELNDYELKASCLMALLAMGTSHNRWYVEHKFVKLTGAAMDNNLAERLAIEFRVTDRLVCQQISHLEMSINVRRTALHPVIQSALSQICL